MMTSWNGNILCVTGHLCGEFTGPQRPVTRSFAVLFDLHPNRRLSKQWWGWWFETPSCPLWRHCNVNWLSPFSVFGASEMETWHQIYFHSIKLTISSLDIGPITTKISRNLGILNLWHSMIGFLVPPWQMGLRSCWLICTFTFPYILLHEYCHGWAMLPNRSWYDFHMMSDLKRELTFP